MRPILRIFVLAVLVTLIASAAWRAAPASGADAAAIAADLAKESRGKIQPIEDESGAMNAFYAQLSRTAAKLPGAVTRVAHFGDSTIEMDLTPGPMRRLMATRFGDGGRGFILMGRPKPWYRPYDVEFDPDSTWIASDVKENDVKDRRFGLGGAYLLAYKEKASTTFGTAKGGPTGEAVSRFELLVPVRPDNGSFAIEIDGKSVGTISAAGADAEGVAEFRLPDGKHTIEITALTKDARAYGVILGRDGPGVVWDALGVNGTGVPSWLSANEDNWIAHLRHRNPDLIILALGTNDTSPDLDLEAYRKLVARLIERARKAVPGASILWQAPLDRATKSGGDLVTNPMLPRIVEIQRAVAKQQKVAFWSAYDAMGGNGSMARWYKAKPQLGAADLFHPTREGGEVIAKMLYDAMMTDFAKYLQANGVATSAREAPASPLVKLQAK